LTLSQIIRSKYDKLIIEKGIRGISKCYFKVKGRERKGYRLKNNFCLTLYDIFIFQFY